MPLPKLLATLLTLGRPACYFTAALLAGVACTGDLPAPTLVQDLRVLAMQADPPEILSDGPQPVDSNFTALVVDPRGGRLHYAWQFCPVVSAVACRDLDTLVAGSGLPQAVQDGLTALAQLQISGSVEGQGVYAIPAFNPKVVGEIGGGVDATANLFTLYAELDVFSALQGTWLSAVLTVHKDGEAPVVASKRLVLGPKTPAALAALAQARFGLSLCPAPPAVGAPSCLALPARGANRNPMFAPLSYSLGADPALPALAAEPAPAPLGAPMGSSLRLRPAFTPQSYEPYPSLRSLAQGGALEVVELREDPWVTWYADGGSLQQARTWPKFTGDLSNVLELPAAGDPQADSAINLWMVGGDGRGGETWAQLQVMPSSPP